MEQKLKKIASNFRTAIEIAKDHGEFKSIVPFSRFPRGCCGDTSDLLAQYLLEHHINSLYVCGNRYFPDPDEGTQSHAWLVVNGLIIDITGDQFSDRVSYYNYNERVYVGPGDAFHDLFTVTASDIYEFHGIQSYSNASRLLYLYNIIKKYCE